MNRILTLYLFWLLCGTASAQQIVKWDDLQTITDNARRTVYYEKGSKQPLQGEYRIIRGFDEERVKLSDGIINGDYLRYRDGVLRESGIYAKGKRNGIFTEYYQDGVTPRKETPMQQGKIDGTVKTYFRNGKIETEKEYRQSVESGRERRFDSKTGEQKRVRNGKFLRMGARFAAGLHDTTVTENLTALIVWNRHGTANPI